MYIHGCKFFNLSKTNKNNKVPIWLKKIENNMIYPLDKRNTKKQKNKPADFFVNICILVNIFHKKPK